MIERIIFIGVLLINMNFVIAQNIYVYPEKGFKRVNLNLPPLENEKDYKIEIRFGTEIELSECSKINNISIDFKNLKIKKGFDYHYIYLRFKGQFFKKLICNLKKQNANRKK